MAGKTRSTRKAARPGTAAPSPGIKASPEGTTGPVNIGGREVKLSNLHKVLYPASGFTKADVIDYYARIAPVIIPHLRGRPLTLKRYPNGVDSEFFYEKMCPAHRPDWVSTTKVVSEGGKRPFVQYCVVDDVATLVWVANLASLELHTLAFTGRRGAEFSIRVDGTDIREIEGKALRRLRHRDGTAIWTRFAESKEWPHGWRQGW